MNVLQLVPSLDVGGVETGTIDLAVYLAQNGHKAVVVSSGGRLVKGLESVKAIHYGLPVDKKSIFSVIAMIAKVRRIIRNENIDIVHARSRVPAWIGYFAAKFERRPFVTTAHGHYDRHLLSAVMSWGKIVIVASNAMARHMVHDFGVPYERIRIIPRGVDAEKFKFIDPSARPERDFTVGIVSRITPLKGHADFLKAISILNRSVPRLKAVVIGEAPKRKSRYKEDLMLLARRLGINRIVEFLGAREDVPNLLAGLDVLVSSTVTQEAFGRSIIEAQARGVAVVATRVGGVVDVIEDGKNGLLSDPEDPKALADNVLKIYRDGKLRESLVRNARKTVEENFTSGKMFTRTLEVYEEAIRSSNILVIKMSSVGDCVLSIPSLKGLRSKFKEARIKLLVSFKCKDVFRNCPYIDETIVCDFEKRHRGPAGFRRLAGDLMRNQFDMAVDLQNNKTSHMLAFSSLAADRYGYDNGKFGFLLNRRIKDDGLARDPLEHQLQTLKMLGIASIEKTLELFPSKGDEEWAEEFLRNEWVKPTQRLVGISLRASSRWLTKNWPLENMVELSSALAREFNARIVITGSEEDAELAGRFSRLSGLKPIIAAGKTNILELASLMKRFRVYLTGDSAPMHVASSVGTPVVALFGPTDPARHFVPDGRSVVIKRDFRCAPCYRPRCLMAGHRCMKAITVDEVLSAVKRFM